MSLKKILIQSVFLYMSLSGYSQTKKPATKSKPAPATAKIIKQGDNTLLWEISGMGITEPSYLYGTMHIVCEEDAKMSEGLKNAIAKSKQVFFEIDMDDMEEMMGMIKY